MKRPPLLFISEAVKWLSKREIRDDVEGGVVIPTHDVYRLRTFLHLIVQSLNKQIHKPLHQPLLFFQCLVTKRVTQIPPHPGVISLPCSNEVPLPINRRCEPSAIFEICTRLVFAGSETIDIWPGGFPADEGDFVRVYADGIAIGFVELFYPRDCCAAYCMQTVWDSRGTC